MATIHLVEGPVGAGKSTFAAKLSLSHGEPHLNLDEWMVTLFSPDRPNEGFMEWYSDRKSRCIQQIWDVTCELLNNGISAILELGLVRCADREDFYRRVVWERDRHMYDPDFAAEIDAAGVGDLGVTPTRPD